MESVSLAANAPVACLFGVIRIERGEIIQMLLDDPVAFARPLL
jgi:hypothetical protein